MSSIVEIIKIEEIIATNNQAIDEIANLLIKMCLEEQELIRFDLAKDVLEEMKKIR